MKHLRVTASIDPEAAPGFFTHLADAPAIDETRLLEWSMPPTGPATVLFAIDGDARPFAEDVPDLDAVSRVELSAPSGRPTYAIVDVETAATPVFAAIRDARTRPGFVVRKPVVYRDGEMRFRVVGEGAALQAAFDDAPAPVTVRVEEITSLGAGLEPPASALTDRQREALETALALGYYDQPRAATHEDVAGELDCAAPTASEHLRKAESRLVRAALDEFQAEP
ncbi:helix-turn-helix domain-containing protein [Halobacteriales archaeon Cl-PHB]